MGPDTTYILNPVVVITPPDVGVKVQNIPTSMLLGIFPLTY